MIEEYVIFFSNTILLLCYCYLIIILLQFQTTIVIYNKD